MAYEINEQKKIGLGLIGFGIFFSLLGVILFFDRGLLALGNIFWLSGVALLLGLSSTWKLFTNKANYKGTVSFLVGLFLIFVRWPIVGIILEIYGCIVLFGGFWPSVKAFLNQIPVLGWVISYLFWFLIHCREASIVYVMFAYKFENRLYISRIERLTKLTEKGPSSSGFHLADNLKTQDWLIAKQIS